MFIQLMEEQKQSFMGQINDLENKIKKLTEDLKAAQAASTSDSSN